MNYLEIVELDSSLILVKDSISNYYNFCIDYADKFIYAVSKKDYIEYKIYSLENYYIDNRKNIPDQIKIENEKIILIIGK